MLRMNTNSRKHASICELNSVLIRSQRKCFFVKRKLNGRLISLKGFQFYEIKSNFSIAFMIKEFEKNKKEFKL